MSEMAFQITSLTIVYSTVYSRHSSKKHQSSRSLAFVRGIHRWSVNSLHKGLVMQKKFPFHDVIMHSIHKGRTMWVVLPWDYLIMHLLFKMFAVYRKWLQGVQEVTITEFSRLKHSPCLVAVGLSVCYETRVVIGWHCPFVIGCLNNRLGSSLLHSIVGSHDP